VALRQIHGAAVLGPEDVAAAGSPGGDAPLPAALPAGDALVSVSAGTLLTIRTADCVPILLVSQRARAVAAVHAGWRGLVAGVVGNAVKALGFRYGARAAELCAAIGPAICGSCYEFGAEHRGRFRSVFGSAVDQAWGPAGDPGRARVDLRLVVRIALEQAGLKPNAIATVGPCTVEHPTELHSYRRDGARAGRQLSYIGWSESRD
jgi:YfiH family protein